VAVRRGGGEYEGAEDRATVRAGRGGGVITVAGGAGAVLRRAERGAAPRAARRRARRRRLSWYGVVIAGMYRGALCGAKSYPLPSLRTIDSIHRSLSVSILVSPILTFPRA